ncbi:glycerol-3-phosphate dehydrogenase/oxidase [Thermodesulfobacteriota bacterium]
MEKNKNDNQMKNIKESWDLVIIGGGVTGAGIFREAVRMGVSSLLVEQKDFSWGTSSRSSKLVHGGLRYLKEGRIFLTRDSVREREKLLEEAPGLVELVEFIVPIYKGRGPGRWTLEAGLSLYDLISKKRKHKYFDGKDFEILEPHLDRKDLVGGFQFSDAQVDDSRLVLRLIFEAIDSGGSALNYTAAESIHRNENGEVTGLTLKDTKTGEERLVSTNVVINATGVWAEKLQPSPDRKMHLRPLRGSHLIFPGNVIPIKRAVSFSHPEDERPVFLVPWEGVVLAGTTDLDHVKDLSLEPAISEEEAAYLMEAVHSIFPSLDISEKDCISTMAGVRPVLSEGKRAASEESREHVIWKDRGLVTITGGKLTTFRKLALDTLKAAKEFIPQFKNNMKEVPVFSALPEKPGNDFGLSPEIWKRIFGRYGEGAIELVTSAKPEDLEFIPGTHTIWAELPYAAKNENVRHLTDLLLRRVRIGILVPYGAMKHMPRIKKLCRSVLPWDRMRWKQEINEYKETWKRAHSYPGEYPEPGFLRTSYNRIKNLFKKD